MNKFDIKSQQTKESIINTFWELSKEKEISKIKIKDITDRMGIYRSTFYLHFQDIIDLLSSEEDLLVESWKNKAVAIASNATPQELLVALSNYYIENSDKVFTLLRDRVYSRYEEKMKTEILNHIHELYPQTNTDVFDYTFEFYISAIIGVLLKWNNDGRKDDINEVIKRILHLLQHGLGEEYWIG